MLVMLINIIKDLKIKIKIVKRYVRVLYIIIAHPINLSSQSHNIIVVAKCYRLVPVVNNKPQKNIQVKINTYFKVYFI